MQAKRFTYAYNWLLGYYVCDLHADRFASEGNEYPQCWTAHGDDIKTAERETNRLNSNPAARPAR